MIENKNDNVQQTPPPKKNNSLCILAIVGVVVFVGIVGIAIGLAVALSSADEANGDDVVASLQVSQLEFGAVCESVFSDPSVAFTALHTCFDDRSVTCIAGGVQTSVSCSDTQQSCDCDEGQIFVVEAEAGNLGIGCGISACVPLLEGDIPDAVDIENLIDEILSGAFDEGNEVLDNLFEQCEGFEIEDILDVFNPVDFTNIADIFDTFFEDKTCVNDDTAFICSFGIPLVFPCDDCASNSNCFDFNDLYYDFDLDDLFPGDYDFPFGDYDIPFGDYDIPFGDYDFPFGDDNFPFSSASDQN
jgi:hypothetical protein